MKKLFVSAAVMSAMFLASCGGSEVCDCTDMMVEMTKASQEEGADQEAIQKKYAADLEKCINMGEGKTDEELKEMEAAAKECSSSKELEDLMKM